MNNIEFTKLLLDNLHTYIYILIPTLIIYSLLLKKYIHGITDPMFFCCIGAAFAGVVPFFLYVTNLCNLKMLLYYIFAEIAFWMGFALNYNKRIHFNNYTIKKENTISFYLYISFFIIFVLLKLLNFKYLGIPLFMGNRLEATINAGGLAILNKIADPLQFYCNVYSYYLFSKKKTLSITCLILIFLFSFLSGSKSFILTFVFAYFTYSFFFKNKVPIIPKKIIICIFLTPIFTLLVSGMNGDLAQAVGNYLFRIVAYGDIYWYSLPDNVIENIPIESSFKHLFSGILGPLRIMSYDDNAIPLGTKLYWYTMPIELYGTNGGPNSRPVILGFWLYKYAGIIFCYISGLCMSGIMTKLPKFLPEGIISAIFVGYFYNTITSMATDPVLTINLVFTVILFAITLFITYNLIFERKITLIRLRKNRTYLTNTSLLLQIFYLIIFIIISTIFYITD